MDEAILVVIRKDSEHRRVKLLKPFSRILEDTVPIISIYFWSADTVVGYRGENPVSALSSKLDTDPDSEAYRTVYKLVWRL